MGFCAGFVLQSSRWLALPTEAGRTVQLLLSLQLSGFPFGGINLGDECKRIQCYSQLRLRMLTRQTEACQNLQIRTFA